MILALASIVAANEVHNVPVTLRIASDGGVRRVEAEGKFRESLATLKIDVDADSGRITEIVGTLDGTEFKVDVNSIKAATDFQFHNTALHADCCINGYAVSWQVPFGAQKQCIVDTPKGRERQLVHAAIYITIDRGGGVRRASLIEC
jgi:hypothetical protein